MVRRAWRSMCTNRNVCGAASFGAAMRHVSCQPITGRSFQRCTVPKQAAIGPARHACAAPRGCEALNGLPAIEASMLTLEIA